MLHAGIDENMLMNKWHLILVIERLRYRSRIPKPEDALPWGGIFLALLLALIPADFQDFAGFPAAVWEAGTVILAIVSLA